MPRWRSWPGQTLLSGRIGLDHDQLLELGAELVDRCKARHPATDHDDFAGGNPFAVEALHQLHTRHVAREARHGGHDRRLHAVVEQVRAEAHRASVEDGGEVLAREQAAHPRRQARKVEGTDAQERARYLTLILRGFLECMKHVEFVQVGDL